MLHPAASDCAPSSPNATQLSMRPNNVGLLQEADQLLMQQFQRLTAGLEDPAPAVRVAAIAGICQILNVFWEMVPSATTAAYLKQLTGAERLS